MDSEFVKNLFFVLGKAMIPQMEVHWSSKISYRINQEFSETPVKSWQSGTRAGIISSGWILSGIKEVRCNNNCLHSLTHLTDIQIVRVADDTSATTRGSAHTDAILPSNQKSEPYSRIDPSAQPWSRCWLPREGRQGGSLRYHGFTQNKKQIFLNSKSIFLNLGYSHDTSNGDYQRN